MKIKSIKKVILDKPKQYYDVIEANPYNNFIIKTNNSYIISHNCNFTDEVNFGLTNDVEKLKKKQKMLISQIDARMKSRFMRTKDDGNSYLPTLNIIASSKNSEQSFLDEYINTKKRNESKTTLIVDEPQWVVDSRKDSPIKFWVAIGNKFLANELLPLGISDDDLAVYRNKGYTLIAVPIGYLDNFQDNIDGALTDIAGIATASSLKYISGERLNQAKTETYKNPFTKDIIEVGNSPNDHLQYANFFDMSVINQDDLGKPMFIHLDMSMSGDKTGIAGVWITGKQATSKIPQIATTYDTSNSDFAIEEAGEQELDDSSRDLRYKLAFSVSIQAPKGYQVSFEKNRNFIRWLRDKGFAIKGVSSDTFQSATIQQELKSDGFNTSILSVDRVDKASRTCIPYQYFKSAIYEQRVLIYNKCDLLTEEIVGLERQSDGHINHPDNGTHGSKDQCDAFCLHGDTKIFLLNGKHKTIKELYEQWITNPGLSEWVLAYDIDKHKFSPVKIAGVLNNGLKSNLIKLTLDNGQELTCTEDHKILARNGEYVEAKDTLGVSLMPFSYENKIMYKNRDYPYIYNPNQDGTISGIYLHKLVAESLKLKDKIQKQNSKQDNEWVVIHHIDMNRQNCAPDNLEYLTNIEHSNIHCNLNTSDIKRKQVANAMKELAKQGGLHPFQNLSQEQQLYKKQISATNITKYNKTEHHRQVAKETNRKLSLAHQHPFQLYKETAHTKEANIIRKLGNCVKLFLQSKNLTYIDTFLYDEFLNYFITNCEKNKDFNKRFKNIEAIITYENILKLGFNLYNHRVIKIDRAPSAIVYDIQLEEIHNFALTNGLIVHNCGALFLASKFADEYSYSYGDNLSAALETNTLNDNSQRQQLLTDFKAELAQVRFTSSQRDAEEAEHRQRQIEEAEYYSDLQDGIIII